MSVKPQTPLDGLGVCIFRKGDTIVQKRGTSTFVVRGILLKGFDLYLYVDGQATPVKAEDFKVTKRA